MAEPGQDDGRVFGALAVRNLHAAGIQEAGVSTQLGKSCLHRVAGPRGLFKEHQEHGLIRQIVGGHAHGEFFLQVKGYFQHGIDFFFGEVLQIDEVPATEYRLHDNTLPQIMFVRN